jgi:hypothetical protein
MRAKTINNFERGLDPKQAMGIGTGSLDSLRPGNIIQAKMNLDIEWSGGKMRKSHSTSKMASMYKGDYLMIISHVKTFKTSKNDVKYTENCLKYVRCITLEIARECTYFTHDIDMLKTNHSLKNYFNFIE